MSTPTTPNETRDAPTDLPHDCAETDLFDRALELIHREIDDADAPLAKGTAVAGALKHDGYSASELSHAITVAKRNHDVYLRRYDGDVYVGRYTVEDQDRYEAVLRTVDHQTTPKQNPLIQRSTLVGKLSRDHSPLGTIQSVTVATHSGDLFETDVDGTTYVGLNDEEILREKLGACLEEDDVSEPIIGATNEQIRKLCPLEDDDDSTETETLADRLAEVRGDQSPEDD